MGRPTRWQWLLLIVFGWVHGIALADNYNILVPRVSGSVQVDGVLDEPQWQDATPVELIYVTRPFENATPPVKTTAYVFESGDTLYLGFVAQDNNPEEIRAFFRDRDEIFGDDLVGIKLDTSGDSRLAYQFFVNPFGIQTDSIENEMTRSESDSWDAIWDSAGQITDDGYIVEMALPFRMMNFDDTGGPKEWRAEFVRFYPRDLNLRISNMPLDRNNSCTLCLMGDVTGFDEAKQSQNLTIVPYVVAGSTRSRDPVVNRDWAYDNNQEVGVDVNWGITSDILLQATLNPDFSQVEADAGQLAINNPFALFFPEQRPFFLENEDFFSSMYNLVYTRNVGAPDYGAKVTARLDEQTFGLFVANDVETTFLVPGNLGSRIARFDEESINMAMRYRYDVSDNLSFGSIVTARDAEGYNNTVVGLDTRYQITPTDLLRVQVLRSDTEYPDDLFRSFCRNECRESEDFSEAVLRTQTDDNLTDLSYWLRYNHEERDWFFSASHQFFGEDFRADLGFEDTVDFEKSVLGGGYIWYDEESWWNRITIQGDWDITHNDNGELLEREVQAEIGVNAAYQSYFEIFWTRRERVGQRHDPSLLAIEGNSDRFIEEQWQFYAEAQPNRSVYLETFVRIGDRLDFDNNRMGRQLLIEPFVELNLGKHTELGLFHSYNRLKVGGQDLFTANLSDLRLTYQFDPKQFLRVALIYSDVERNQDNYLFPVDANDRSLGSQIVYSYMVNPLTRLFVGYSDSAFADDELPGLTRDNQSVFVKFSYAWLR